MRKFCCQAVTVVVLVLCTARIAESQSSAEMLSGTTTTSGVLDLIKKLSGPGMASVGLQFGFDQCKSPIRLNTDRQLQLRVGLLIGTTIHKGDSVLPEDSKIYMATVQPTIKIPFAQPWGILLEAVVGVGVHGFLSIEPDSAGGDSGTFVHASLPIFVQTPIKLGQYTVAVGVGGRAFPPFPDRAFQPVRVGVGRSNWEWSWGAGMTFEF